MGIMTFDMVIAVIRIQGNSGDIAGNVTSFPWGLSNFGIRIKLRPVGKPLFYGRRKSDAPEDNLSFRL